jgi:serine/arginine repetitive matrix protein 1
MKNVTLDAIKPWIAARVTELLGIEDEVLIGFIFEMLEKVSMRSWSQHK